jgi:hypothetical protein
MAGFCANSNLIKDKIARFRSDSPPGKLEHLFLKQLVNDIREVEPLLDNCSRIYAWHVKMETGHYIQPSAKWDPALKHIEPAV